MKGGEKMEFKGVENDLEYKQVSFELKNLNEETGIFEGYAAIFGNIDSYGDVIERGAFAKTIQTRANRIKICWQHNPNEPIGIPLELKEDDRGLYVKGKISLTSRGKDVLTLMRDGVINELSIGYNSIDHTYDGNVRHLKEVELWEISPVTWAANNLAVITNVKKVTPFSDLPLADPSTSWDAGAARKKVADWAQDDMKKFAKAFFWYDEKNADNLTAYKLPFADIIDGKLMAVPRGIYAAAAAIQGARGGVDIPSSDIPAVKAHIAKYYAKLGQKPPWEKELDVLELISYIEVYAEQIKSMFDVKAGRMISTSNLSKLKAALAALQEIIDLAEGNNNSDDGNKNANMTVDAEVADEILNEFKKLTNIFKEAN